MTSPISSTSSDPFKGKTKREIMIEIGQDIGPEPGIYNYANDIPFKINLTLKDKGHTVSFLNSIFDTLGIIGDTKRAKYLSNLKTIAANQWHYILIGWENTFTIQETIAFIIKLNDTILTTSL